MELGAQYGSYKTLRILGRGGMGVVYEAEHALIGKRVAVKTLRKELSHDRELVQRFFNEARATTQIRHPGIIEIFDFGFDSDGTAYIAMELLAGESLASRLRREHQLDVDLALVITRQVASAVGAAHAAGVVHRDLKPDNVFLVPHPEIPAGIQCKVLDFGIAKLQGDDARDGHVATKTGALLGTPLYMSPEQCRGIASIDHRTDIYALGVMLYEMVSGDVPFRGEGAGDIIAAHIHLTPPLPKRDGLAADVVGLIGEMLGKKPDTRPQTMDAIVARLAPARVSQPRPAAITPPRADVDAVAATLDGSDPALVGPSATADTVLPTEPSPPPAMTPAPPVRRDPTPIQAPPGSTTTLGGASGSTTAVPPPPSRRGVLLGAAGVGVAAIGGGAWLLTRGSSSSAPAKPKTWPLQIDFRMPRWVESIPDSISVSVDGFVAKVASKVVTPPAPGLARSVVVLVEATERFLGNEQYADWGVIDGLHGSVRTTLEALDQVIAPSIAVQVLTYDTATSSHGSFARREPIVEALRPQADYGGRLGSDVLAAIDRARRVLARRAGVRQLLIIGTGLPLELDSTDAAKALAKQLQRDQIGARAALHDPVGGFDDDIAATWKALGIKPRMLRAPSELSTTVPSQWGELPEPWRIDLELSLPQGIDPDVSHEVVLELFEEHTFHVDLVNAPRVDLGELQS